MKEYPIYKSNRDSPEVEKAFNKLSEKNKRYLDKFMIECSVLSKAKKRTENRRRAIIRLNDFLEKDFDKITYDDYVKVAGAISNSKLGTYARNGDRDFIKRFLRDIFPDWRGRFKDFKLLKSEQKSEDMKVTPNDILTDLEIDKLIRTSENMKTKALISVLCESAARPEELLKLRWSDVDFNSKVIYLYSIKTKKKRAVPINESISHLKRLKSEMDYTDSDYIFSSTFSKRNNKPMTSAALNLILKNLADKAGIEKNVYPYIFRHSRLSVLIRKLSPKVYEMVSGHSLEMGMKTYSHLSKDIVIKEMQEKVFQAKELTEKEKSKLEIEIQQNKKEFQDFKRMVIELLQAPEQERTEQLIKKLNLPISDAD